ADWRLQRATVFDASGRVNSTTRIPAPEGLPSPRLQAATPRGATWWKSFRADDPPVIAAVPREDAPPLIALRFPKTTCSVSRRTSTGSVSAGVPFCHDERTTFSANGEFAAEAVPLTLVDGSNGLQVAVVSVQGDTVLDRRLPLAASPIPGAIRDSAINYRLGRASALLRELYQ